MSQSYIRTTVSFMTLNALLTIYETQPLEFYDNNHSINLKLNSLIYLPWYVYVLTASLGILFDKNESSIKRCSSFLVNGSVIVQNLNLYFPKTLNMVLIYYQLIMLIYSIYILCGKIYDSFPQQVNQKTKFEYFTSNSQSRKQQPKLQKERKRRVRKSTTTSDQIDNQNIESKQQENIEEACSIKKVDSIDYGNETENETENVFEFNHADLSQISSIDTEPSTIIFKIQYYYLKLNLMGKLEMLNVSLIVLITLSISFPQNTQKNKQFKLKFTQYLICMIQMKTVSVDYGVQRSCWLYNSIDKSFGDR